MGSKEPPPWERREPSRKHERSPSADASAAQRCKDRELPRSSPSRRSPSPGMCSSELSRTERIWAEGESLYPSGRYGGSGMGRLRHQSPYRSPSDDTSRPPLPLPPPPPMTGLRSLAVPIATQTQAPLKNANSGMGMRPKADRDHSLGSMGWKATKWSRPSSISLAKVEEATTNDTATSLSEASPRDGEDVTPRKKARIGWGQGLLKYEMQKVQELLDSPVHGSKSGPGDSSPGMTRPEGCLSAISLPSSSPRSSSSPVMDEKPCARTTSCDITASHCDMSRIDSEHKEFTIKLDNFKVKCASSLKALLDDLLQPEDACSGDSTSTRHAAKEKLLLLKADISKELEKTECEIDLLEGEMKSICSGAKSASLQSIIDAAKVSLVSSDVDLKDYIQPEGTCLLSQAEAENPISSTILECTALADSKAGNSLVISPKCGRKFVNSGICCTGDSLARSTASMNTHGLILKEEHKDAHLEQVLATKYGDRNVCCIETDGSGRCCLVPSCSHGRKKSKLNSYVMESNLEVAKRASHAFHGLGASPSNPTRFNISDLVKLSSQMKNDKRIKEKISARKRQLKLKEKVLTLKYMAFRQLWKKDPKLLSTERNHTKSNKCSDTSNRQSHSGFQKRSSLRSRLAPSDYSLTPVEELEVLHKLLSDSQIKIYRSSLSMPPLILDMEESRFSFVCKNGLIEDPLSHELERFRVNPWAQEEKKVFVEMFAKFGKNFAKISSCLSHKTTADCIEYYYKNNKSDSFNEAKKHMRITKRSRRLPPSTYLVTSERKWSHERNAAALDMLGTATVAAALNLGTVKVKQKDNGRSVYRSCHALKAPLGCHNSSEKVHDGEISVQERESVAADVLAGISSALLLEEKSSCVTSSVGQAAKMNLSKLDDLVLQNFDEDSCSDEDCGELGMDDWTEDEKSGFVQALSIHGKDYTKISSYLGTRSSKQCKKFFAKTQSSLDLDVIHSDSAAVASDDTNGRSDVDETCAADVDSAICSTQSCSKVNEDVSQPICNANYDHGGTSVQSEVDGSSAQDTTGGIDFSESCADKQESTVNNDKIRSEEDNPRPCASKEGNTAALSARDTTGGIDFAESCADNQESTVNDDKIRNEENTPRSCASKEGNTVALSAEDTTGGIDFAESCADKQESTINDDKIGSKENNPRCCASKEGNTTALSGNDFVHLQKEAQNMCIDSAVVENNVNAPQVHHLNKTPVDCDVMSQLGSVTQQNDIAKSSSDVLKSIDPPYPVVMEIGSNNRRRTSFDLVASSGIICFAQDFNSGDNVLKKGIVVDTIPRPSSAPNFQPQEVLPEMVSDIPSNQEAMLSSAHPSSLCFAGSSHIASRNQNTLNFQGHANGQHQNSAAVGDLYQQFMLKNDQQNQFSQPMDIHRGHSLSILRQQVQDKVRVTRPSLLQNSLKLNRFLHTTKFVSNMQDGIMNGSSHAQLHRGILSASEADNTAEIQPLHCSWTAIPETSKQPADQSKCVLSMQNGITNGSSHAELCFGILTASKASNTAEIQPILCSRIAIPETSKQPNDQSELDSSMQNGITNGSSHAQLHTGILSASKAGNTAEIQPIHCSRTAIPETSKQPTDKSGGIKLFGKIIAQAPHTESATPSMEQNQVKVSMPNESLNMMPSSMIKDGIAFPSSPGSSSLVNLSEQPRTTVWNASRMLGFPSLSDAARIMANYQSLKPAMPLVMNGQVMPGYRQPCMQQLSSDGRRNDNLSLPPSRNVEIMRGLQPSTSGARVGANLASNRGMFASGEGGISDPVAALKMQYASGSNSRASEKGFWR